MTERPSVKCSLCSGTGHRALGALHWETLRQLSHTWVSTAAIEAAHRPKQCRTTLIERLNVLVRAGLVESQKHGRGLQWRRAPSE